MGTRECLDIWIRVYVSGCVYLGMSGQFLWVYPHTLLQMFGSYNEVPQIFRNEQNRSPLSLKDRRNK